MESLYMLGGFNAREGADSEAWSTCLGHHGIGRIKENGQRLLELCCHHGLCVSNTYFQCKELHMVSWRHQRSHHWHQLDLVITRNADLCGILDTHSHPSAGCDTDLSCVASIVRLMPKKLNHSENKRLTLHEHLL